MLKCSKLHERSQARLKMSRFLIVFSFVFLSFHIVSNFDLPAIARDLPAIAVCAGIAHVRRPCRWQAGAGT